MLYEGNDFRSAKSDRKRERPSFSKQLRHYFKQSRLVMAADRFLIDTFGPINSDGHVPGIEVLDWLPLGIPQGEGAKYYAFAPKQLRDLYMSPDAFAVDRHWLNPRAQIAEMKALCDAAGARLIVVYAPVKAHVVLPLAAGWLDPATVLAFTAISYKGDLPNAATFWANLLAWVDSRERVVGAWCQREGIPFLGLTRALAAATRNGTQTYFTYDQHWSPDGHLVVARALADMLTAQTASEESAARPHQPSADDVP
jgi:hypothetical protein